MTRKILHKYISTAAPATTVKTMPYMPSLTYGNMTANGRIQTPKILTDNTLHKNIEYETLKISKTYPIKKCKRSFNTMNNITEATIAEKRRIPVTGISTSTCIMTITS